MLLPVALKSYCVSSFVVSWFYFNGFCSCISYATKQHIISVYSCLCALNKKKSNMSCRVLVNFKGHTKYSGIK